jgi:hypothetical protein
VEADTKEFDIIRLSKGQKFNLFEILQRYAEQKVENVKKKEPITAFLLMRVIGSSSLYLAS